MKLKGSVAGVLPMMGLLVMAALMAFTSIPLSQSVSQELSESFSDLSRVGETKSYGDIYFFNYVPNGIDYSVSQKSSSLGENGGGEQIEWNSNNFTEDDGLEEGATAKRDYILAILNNETRNYFNENYGDDPSSSICTVPEIFYGTEIMPDSEVADNPSSLPVEVRTAVESGGEAVPLKVECQYHQGTVTYEGRTEEVETDSSTSEETTVGSPTLNTPGLNFGNFNGIIGGENPFEEFRSEGFTKKVYSNSNRYHILANHTAYYFKKLSIGLRDVRENTAHSSWTCNIEDSDRESAITSAKNPIENNITSARTEAEDILNLPSGISIEKSEINSSSNLGQGVSTDLFSGSSSTNTETGDTVCDCDEDGDCDEEEQRVEATVTPDNTEVNWHLNETEKHIMTETGWEQITFKVEPYIHYYNSN